jgi:DNA polymerase-3 subunit beta
MKTHAECLRDLVGFAAPAADAKSAKPILTTVRLAADGEHMYARATDMETYVEAAEPTDGELDPVCVDAQTLRRIAARAEHEVRIDRRSDSLVVASNGNTWTLATMDADEFPDPPEPDGPPVAAPGLPDAVARVAPAAARTMDRYALGGVEIAVRDGEMTAAATDTFRLHAAGLVAACADADDAAAIVPLAAAKWIASVSPDGAEDDPSVAFGACVRVSCATRHVWTRTIEASFPEWGKLLAGDLPVVVPVDREEAMAALDAASICIDAETAAVAIVVSGARMEFRARDGRGSDATAVAACPDASADMSVRVNAGFLRDAFAAARAETVSIEARDGDHPIRIIDGAFRCMISPVCAKGS